MKNRAGLVEIIKSGTTAFTRRVAIAFFTLILFPVLAMAAGEEIYQEYNQFCLDNFGAEHESLVYETFGDTLQFVESGFWVHESMNSAAIGFETNLPSKTYVEYGETAAYGQRTADPERYFYLQLHYLTGLQPDRTYHYRLVAVDERGNQIVSPDKTLQTHTFSGAIMVPGNLSGPPYILNQPGALYILTEDINSDTRGISIKAQNVTVDLNGHTVTYDEGTPLVQGQWNDYLYSDISTSGVHYFLWSTQGLVKILNGTIVQGQNNGQGHISVGFNPILISGGTVEVAGITAVWSGHSVGGIDNHWGTLNAHHNALIDRGTGIDNRHQGIKALYTANIGADGIHHNLIKRARQQVIMSGNDSDYPIYANEIYQDSYDTNAFGIRPVKQVYRNKMFGTGYHVNAIGWRSGVTVRDNFIHLQGVEPTNRSGEYGLMASVNGIRLTQYGGGTTLYENNLYEGNTIIVKGRAGTTTMRGVQFFSDPYVVNLRFRNNIIKTEVQDEVTPPGACVVAQGLSDRYNEQLPILYENNRFISNSVFVKFADDYGGGGNHIFRNNSFEKFGNRSHYHAFRLGYWIYHTIKNRLIDSALNAGVDLEDNVFSGTGMRDYSVGHSLYVIAKRVTGEPIANATLEVEDSTGINYSIQTDGNGLARAELLEYMYAAPQGQPNATKINRTDHQLLISGFEPYLVDAELFEIENNISEPVTLIFTEIGVPPVNQPPSLLAIGNKEVNEGGLLEFTVTAIDPDEEDQLVLSATNLPEGASFVDNGNRSGTFSWTPDFDQAGVYPNVHFEVTDGTASDFENITITVINVNRPPELAPIGNREVNEGELLEFTVTAGDPDAGDTLILSASNLPQGAAFVDHGNRTGTFSWTPGFDQSAAYGNIGFEVSDGAAQDSEVIIITVNNVNRAPVLAPVGNKQVDEGQLLQFIVTASDQDPGDHLTLTASNAPPGASFVDNGDRTGTFTWTPTFEQAGVYPNVHFEVTDGTASDSEDITITVNNVNQPPQITPIDDKVVNEGELLEFTISVSDPDLEDQINLSALPMPDGASLTPSGNREWLFSWTPDYEQAGDYNIVFTASDNGGLSDTEDVGITVIDVDNVPPVIANIKSSTTATTAFISWRTDELSTSQVEYGLTDQYGQSTPIDQRMVKIHTVIITGLRANTAYHFRVKSRDAAQNEGVSNDKTFRTKGITNHPGSGNLKTTVPVKAAVKGR